MKVLVVSNLYPPDVLGGYELGCRQIVDALRGRGHEVRVLTSIPRGPLPSVEHVHRRLRLNDVWSHYLFERGAPVTAHLAQAESLRVNAANVHALLEEVEDFEPDVAYLWMLVGVGGLGLLGALQHLRIPWAWHLMDDLPLALCTSAGRLVPTFLAEFNRQARGTYLACATQLVEAIEAGGIVLNGEVEVIPNWVEGPRFASRREYLRDGVLRIVTAAGRIDRRVDKGIDLLIEAAGRLRDRGHDRFCVDIYGHADDPYFAHLVRRNGLDHFVRFRGGRSQAELTRLYASYDLFAFPTHAREPFGFAPLEAAASGCVPVLSHTCGIAEWLVHGVHAIKCPRDAGSFADAFAAVLEGEIDVSMIGRRVAAVVARDFHIDAIMPRIERALERASARDRSNPGSAEEAYRLAVLAERLSKVLIQEPLCA